MNFLSHYLQPLYYLIFIENKIWTESTEEEKPPKQFSQAEKIYGFSTRERFTPVDKVSVEPCQVSHPNKKNTKKYLTNEEKIFWQPPYC